VDGGVCETMRLSARGRDYVGVRETSGERNTKREKLTHMPYRFQIQPTEGEDPALNTPGKAPNVGKGLGTAEDEGGIKPGGDEDAHKEEKEEEEEEEEEVESLDDAETPVLKIFFSYLQVRASGGRRGERLRRIREGVRG
jgi:hypothetical protein